MLSAQLAGSDTAVSDARKSYLGGFICNVLCTSEDFATAGSHCRIVLQLQLADSHKHNEVWSRCSARTL